MTMYNLSIVVYKWFWEKKKTNYVPKKCYHVAFFQFWVGLGIRIMPWTLKCDFFTDN